MVENLTPAGISLWGFLCCVSPGYGVTIPCIITLLDLPALGRMPPRLARNATHRTA